MKFPNPAQPTRLWPLTGIAAPARPTGLQVRTQQGWLEVSLDWDDVDGADSYRVRWQQAGPECRLKR